MADTATAAPTGVATPPPLPRPLPAAIKPIQQRIKERNFGAIGWGNNRWQAMLTEDQTIDDALTPAFWAHIASKIAGHNVSKPAGLMDIIELRKPDSMDYWELLVVVLYEISIRVRLIREAVAQPITISENSPLTTRWNVCKSCHEVIRTSDKIVMASSFQTKTAAALWIDDHMRRMAA